MGKVSVPPGLSERDFELEERADRRLRYLARKRAVRNPYLWLALSAIVYGLIGVLVILSKGPGPGEGNGVRKVPAPAPSVTPTTIHPAPPAQRAPARELDGEREIAELLCREGVAVRWSDGMWSCWEPSPGPTPSRLRWSGTIDRESVLPWGSLAGDAPDVYLAGDGGDPPRSRIR